MQPKPPYTEPSSTVHLASWDEFTAVARELDGWAFRGHADAAWPLVSSLTRRLQDFCPDRSLWPLREERAMRIFRRKAHIYFSDRQALQDDLRCLALMQHHGAPTRLLDFTKSPFVAAFFAFEQAVTEVAVYALNTPVLWSARPSLEVAANVTLDRDRIDPREPGNYQTYFASNRHPVVWFGEPAEMDSRLVAQSGVFVLPGLLNDSLEDILHGYEPRDDLLRKYVLPAGARDDAMRALYRMNVTHATLFPDLDGLARSIAYELEVVWGRLVDDYRTRLLD